MNQNQNLTKSENSDDELDLMELFGVLLSQKRLIIICIAVAWTVAMIYAYFLPNIYVSKALLSPTQVEGGVSNSLAGYSRLAGLAGINLPSASSSNEKEAIATLTSLSFFKDSFLPKINLPDLLAIESWDEETNTISYDDDLYDPENKKWVGGIKLPSTVPSAQSVYGLFLKENFRLTQDSTTGFVTTIIKHQSPYVAKAWLETIITSINQTLREDQKKRALLSIKYLNEQIATTSYTEIKQELSALVQQETEKLMLIEANEDYVFKIIDPPVVPESPSEPDRRVIQILGAIVGAMLGAMIVFLRHFLRRDH